MPTDGIFAIVLTGGTITAGDEIEEEKPWNVSKPRTRSVMFCATT